MIKPGIIEQIQSEQETRNNKKKIEEGRKGEVLHYVLKIIFMGCKI